MGCQIEVSHIYSNFSERNSSLNETPFMQYMTLPRNSNGTQHDEQYGMDHIRYVCDNVISPIILFFGVIGNAASVTVLRRKRLRHTFDDVELSATSGLVCLALSDTAFCVIGLLAVLMPSQYTVLQDSSTWAVLSMYYNNFKAPLINIFLLTSTWLIIVISVGRYMAIADPFNAKFTVFVRHKHVIPTMIFVLSLAINLPQFLHFRIIQGPCYQGCYCYFSVPGYFYHFVWYHYIWHVIGTLVPLVILIYCNCRLLYQVYKSLHGCAPHRYSTSKITVILVSIITLFLVLVCPSMILTFLTNVSNPDTVILRIGAPITNAMQSLNFAINFVLYSCISKQFRQMLIQTLCCQKPHNHKKNAYANHYQVVRLRLQPI